MHLSLLSRGDTASGHSITSLAELQQKIADVRVKGGAKGVAINDQTDWRVVLAGLAAQGGTSIGAVENNRRRSRGKKAQGEGDKDWMREAGERRREGRAAKGGRGQGSNRGIGQYQEASRRVAEVLPAREKGDLFNLL